MKNTCNQMNIGKNGRTGTGYFAVLPKTRTSAEIAGELRCILSI